MVVVFLMGVEDHEEGGTNLWEEVVDLQVKANPRMQVDPQVAKDLQEEMEANFRLEARMCLLMLPS